MHIGSQFYESSKNIMKSFSSKFKSQSDKEEDDASTIKTNPKKSFNSQLQIHQKTLSQKSSKRQIVTEQNTSFKPEKHFGFNVHNKNKIILKFVSLYFDFFKQQDLASKADQIMHMYKKKLCEKSLIVPTLFCWLNDWITKQFITFLKKQIADLKQRRLLKSNRKVKPFDPFKLQNQEQFLPNGSVIFEIPNKSAEKSRKQSRKQKNMEVYFSINLTSQRSKNELYQKISLIREKSFHQNTQGQELISIQDSKRSKIKDRVYLTIQGRKQNGQNYRNKRSSFQRRNFSFEISNLLSTRYGDLSKKQIQTHDQADSLPINRQVLLGACYQKYYQLYKSLQSVLPDLDINYLRQIKKNDRKFEVKKRIKQISHILTKTQPIIKASVEAYQLYYSEKNKKQSKTSKNKDDFLKKRHKSIKETEAQPKNIKFKLFTNKPEVNITLPKRQIESKLKLKLPKNEKTQQSNNIEAIYQRKKRQQVKKQTLTLNQPISFQFNLPRLPEKNRSAPKRTKQPSKIVLVQSGRYKFFNPADINQLQPPRPKNNLSIQFGTPSIKNVALICQKQQNSDKKQRIVDERSASILQIITKKSKNKLRPYKLQHDNLQAFERKTRKQKKKSFKQKQSMEKMQKSKENYDELISGWQKIEQSTMYV